MHDSSEGAASPAFSSEEEQEVLGLASLFSQASDPTRLRLLMMLISGERCVCELSGRAGVSVSAVSHSLRLLRAEGLVVPRRQGRHIYYRLADDHVRILLSIGLEHVRERTGRGVPWDQAGA